MSVRNLLIPTEITLSSYNNFVQVSGPCGSLISKIMEGVQVCLLENKLTIKVMPEDKHQRANAGTLRATIKAMIVGVSYQYFKVLKICGSGYKFILVGNILTVNVGKARPFKIEIPQTLTVEVDTQTKLIISGLSKELVGLFASTIRNARPIEPYNGRGISYGNENVIRKAIKKVR